MPEDSTIKPRELILGLLLAAPRGELDVAALVRAGEIFGIQGNSIRVTITRLLAEARISSPARGLYRLDSHAKQVARAASGWKSALTELKPWQGHWLTVSVAHLPRTDRTQTRRREKALQLGGFRELRTGFYLRPDNLATSPDRLQTRLCDVGLDADAILCSVQALTGGHDGEARGLWDIDGLNRHYRNGLATLDNWLESRGRLPLELAARESWFMGAEAIRSVVYDPQLPDDWVDAAARRAYFAAVQRMDDCGQAIWAACLL